MVFHDSRNKLLRLIHGRNSIVTFKRCHKLIGPFHNYSSVYLEEEDVGINHFMSDLLDIEKNEKIKGEEKMNKIVNVEKGKDNLECVFKYKCEDFHVYEINKNRNVLNLKYIRDKLISDKLKSNEYENYKKNDMLIYLNEYDKSLQDNILEKNYKEKEGKIDNNLNISYNNHSNEECLHFILYKVNKDTQEAIREISKVSGIPITSFHYSGFKDKRSVSTQIISTKLNYLKELNNLKDYYINKKNKTLLICNIEKVRDKKKIELGEHYGNKFIVVLRNVQNNEDYLRDRLKYIKKYGFINYFGMQRFGIYKNTFNKGRVLISRNYKEYINYVLDPHIFEKRQYCGNPIKDSISIYMKKACELYHKRGKDGDRVKNASVAFRYITHKMNKLFAKIREREKESPLMIHFNNNNNNNNNNCSNNNSSGSIQYKNQNNINTNINVNSHINSKSKNFVDHKYLFSYMTNSEYEAFILLRNLYLFEKNKKDMNNISLNEMDKKDNLDNLKEQHDDNNFYINKIRCIKGISMETRRFHMHSYSAKIFNLLTSYRLYNFGIILTKGDYIITKEKQTQLKELKNQHNYITIYDDETHNVNIHNVVLPVLGTMSPRLSYLNIFLSFYRKYYMKNVRLVFMEILFYLIYILYEDNLFRPKENVVNIFLKNLKECVFSREKKTNKVMINESIQIFCKDILFKKYPIKNILYLIKVFDNYINSFEYEYGMTCVFRNIIVLPKNLYFSFTKYNEPKVKFVQDLYLINLQNKKDLFNIEENNENSKNFKNYTMINDHMRYDKILTKTQINIQEDAKDIYSKNDTLLYNQDDFKNNINKRKQNVIYNYNALILSFSLYSSSYATMLIRELYGKKNELLVHNLIKNCKKYDKKIRDSK
ncbi:putative tRNA pseudouridine synthase D [Plasmodium gaboni]|uniref:Putative tRNA pseudouridine synthase D n=1 Tax=Plasmodium gaboni TaxID=647221 RepID=A0A151LQG9_9APIC|nr:putative tRNA pseudouridine synthase D [Plasmodium gaboni]KYO01434.1 putative tRNA pseudouridine synthase D [Plasmodium gaboni]